MSKRVGIVGYPIRHSISPIFQQAALDHYSLDAIYQAWEVTPDSLPRFVEELRSPDSWGVNVTVPHKEAVLAHLDEVDEWARMAGAVNTVVKQSCRLSGHNTDGLGFLRALEEWGGTTPEGLRALIIGAGGSAKAVALALAGRGVATISIANRTLPRAELLAELIRERGASIEAIPLSDLAEAAARSDLVVNCTTLGMVHGPAENASPLLAGDIAPSTLVYDLVYTPPETPLLREAAKAGAATLGGLPMLVYQGAASFELWTGLSAPVEVMMKAATEALLHRTA